MPPSATPLLRVRDWDRLYENNRSRGMKNTHWLPMPNDLSADSYVELLVHPDGTAHLGVWTGVLMVASRTKPRGSLVREDGRPHDSESLARVMRQQEPIVSAAIGRLLEIGLLEAEAGNSPRKSRLPRHPGAPLRHEAAAEPQKGAAEQNGTEHHHQERNGKEKKGTERAGDQIKTDGSGAGSDAHSFLRTADDEEKPGEVYASPEDELKAIYLAKAGTPITIEVLSAIRENLELTGVGMGDFVAALKDSHVQSDWRNPAGFLRHFSKRFRAKTRVAAPAITAAEAAARDYRCTLCHSKTPGEGVVLKDGKEIPCSCASPEYIARLRERGVFIPEELPK